MPSSIAHASVAILLSPVLGTRVVSRRLVAVAAVAAAVPDLDAIGRPFGRGDIAFLGGHRATTHSLLFALCVALAAAIASRRATTSGTRLLIACYVALVVASHGFLDALATYGEGVAFFAPLSAQRWKFGWQPFSGLLPEILALWFPAAVVFVLWLKPRLNPAPIATRDTDAAVHLR